MSPGKPREASSTFEVEPTLILVADDDPALRSVVLQGLQKAGFEALPARSGAETLALVASLWYRISLILLDLSMPDLDGEQVCRELRRRGADLPIILCSGLPEADVLPRFEGLGLAAFHKKPGSLRALVALVSQVLADSSGPPGPDPGTGRAAPGSPPGPCPGSDAAPPPG